MILVVMLLGGALIAAAQASAIAAACIGCTDRIAFVKSGGGSDVVWLGDFLGKHAQRLGPGDSPLVSPSGGLVAASLSGRPSALALYAPGGTPHTLLNGRRVSASAVSWSPESRYVAVELFGSNPGKHDRDSGLAIVDTQTNTAKVIAHGSICGASFAPGLPDQLAYGRGPAGSFCQSGHVNVFTAAVDGSGTRQITTDGRSLNPVWGPTRIAFDRETVRRKDSPVYQVWLMNPDGSHRSQLTHLKVPSLLDGLVPLQFSANGERMLARYEGEDTSETWTINIANARARQIKVKGESVDPGGLSLDGSTLLVDFGAFLNPPSAGNIETVPFGGGPATVLIRHAGFPSWNR